MKKVFITTGFVALVALMYASKPDNNSAAFRQSVISTCLRDTIPDSSKPKPHDTTKPRPRYLDLSALEQK
jgi:hypothetical protein